MIANTLRIPLEPQPPAGAKVEMLSTNRDPHGRAMFNHAMTMAQAEDTIFYHCPLGLPGLDEDDIFFAFKSGDLALKFRMTDLNVDCVEGVWCWVIDCHQLSVK